MGYVTGDRIGETITGSGTGDLTVGGAVDASYKPLSFLCVNGDTFPGLIVEVDANGNPNGAWETGEYTWTTGGVIQRATVSESSNGNALVNFGAGSKRIYLSLIASYQGRLKSPLILPVYATEPGAAAADTILISADKLAEFGLPFFKNEKGFGSKLQPNIFANDIAWVRSTGLNTFPSIGCVMTNVGTLTTRALAATNMATRTRRTGVVSAATAGAFAESRHTALGWTVGTGTPGLGGFFFYARFVQSNAAAVSGERFYIGLNTSTAAGTNVEPSTLVNCILLAKLSTSNNLQICYGGSAAQTPIDLGANFPANTSNADLYEVAFYAPSALAATIFYEVRRLNTGHVATGTLTGTSGTQVPAATTFLTFKALKTNNATALAVAFDIATMYCMRDN